MLDDSLNNVKFLVTAKHFFNVMEKYISVEYISFIRFNKSNVDKSSFLIHIPPCFQVPWEGKHGAE